MRANEYDCQALYPITRAEVLSGIPLTPWAITPFLRAVARDLAVQANSFGDDEVRTGLCDVRYEVSDIFARCLIFPPRRHP